MCFVFCWQKTKQKKERRQKTEETRKKKQERKNKKQNRRKKKEVLAAGPYSTGSVLFRPSINSPSPSMSMCMRFGFCRAKTGRTLLVETILNAGSETDSALCWAVGPDSMGSAEVTNKICFVGDLLKPCLLLKKTLQKRYARCCWMRRRRSMRRASDPPLYA